MHHGFSLVELSIVLVILGLLTGGILTGQNLIRAAELRSVTTQLTQIQTAIHTFRDRYLALPGDMPNATDFWGIEAGTTGNDDTCYLSESSGKPTCNGNGDGDIHKGYTGTGPHERGRLWQHLANAGLVEGSYTGTHVISGNNNRIGGENALAGKLANTHFNVAWLNMTVAHPGWFTLGEWHLIELTRDFDSPPEPVRDILTPQEAWNIDSKLDDGNPATGKVTAPKQGWILAPDCTTTNDPVTSLYNLDLNARACPIFFNGGF